MNNNGKYKLNYTSFVIRLIRAFSYQYFNLTIAKSRWGKN